MLLSELPCRDPLGIHVWLQCFRNNHAAVGLLVILKYGQPGASDGQPTAIQRVYKFGLPAAFRTPANIRSSRLVRLEIRTGGNLPKELLPRQPYFKVISFG